MKTGFLMIGFGICLLIIGVPLFLDVCSIVQIPQLDFLGDPESYKEARKEAVLDVYHRVASDKGIEPTVVADLGDTLIFRITDVKTLEGKWDAEAHFEPQLTEAQLAKGCRFEPVVKPYGATGIPSDRIVSRGIDTWPEAVRVQLKVPQEANLRGELIQGRFHTKIWYCVYSGPLEFDVRTSTAGLNTSIYIYSEEDLSTLPPQPPIPHVAIYLVALFSSLFGLLLIFVGFHSIFQWEV